METRHETDAAGTENSLAMVLVEQREPSYDDVMARRIKNRERQRRYRARKRLEADMKRAYNVNDSASPHGQLQVYVAPYGCESRILCRRNWKQDARRAHVVKQQELIPNDHGTKGDPSIQNQHNSGNYTVKDDTERRVVPGRRHWKADARNKKTENGG